METKNNMKNIEIIRVTPGDIDPLQQISIQSFSEAFAALNTEENMRSYLEKSFSKEKLTAELNHPDSGFYFARLGKRIIGYLKLNTGSAQTEYQDDKALEIERIYVLKEYHGQYAGQLLFEKSLEVARQMNADYIWLGVWEENTRAINFYQKNGFAAFDQHIFKLGDDEQTDIIMKLNLQCH
jgi:ribosomal protein S18 acetylase RimI-like enzyme